MDRYRTKLMVVRDTEREREIKEEIRRTKRGEEKIDTWRRKGLGGGEM